MALRSIVGRVVSAFVPKAKTPAATAPSNPSAPTNTTQTTQQSTQTSNPTLGYGGANYETADRATRNKIVEDKKKLQTDQTFKQSETERALGVIEARKAQGLDVSAQEKYLKTLGYDGNFSVDKPEEPAPPTGPEGPDTGGLIEQIYNNQYDSQSQMLRKARDIALQGLNSVATGAKQGAYSSRNQADVVNMQNAERMKEVMASQGLMASGDNITANIGLAAARQGSLNDINQQLNNTLTDVDERRTLINNNAAGDELALRQQVDAARGNAMLNDAYRMDDRTFRLAEMMGAFNGQKTLAGQGFDWQKSTDQRNYDRGVVESDRGYDYQAGRDKVGDSQWQKQFDQGKYESDRNYQFQMQQSSIANGQWQQQFQLDVEKWGFQKASEMWNQSFQESQANQTKTITAKDMAPYFDGIVQRNENGQITNEDSVRNSIVNSDLSDYEAYQLYNRYGFKWDGEVPGK